MSSLMSNAENNETISTAIAVSPGEFTIEEEEDDFESEPKNYEIDNHTSNGKSVNFSIIESPTHQVADDTAEVKEASTDEDIELLNANVDRHINVISRWILSEHEKANNESYWWQGFAGSAGTIRDKLMPTSFNSNMKTSASAVLEGSNSIFKRKESTEKKKPVSDAFFPPMVEVAPKVEASFHALDECLLTAIKMKTSGDREYGINKVQSIIEQVAQVPSLVKTIMLIHKKDDRERIISSKIVRRVLFCRFSLMDEDTLEKNRKLGEGKDINNNESSTRDNTASIFEISDEFEGKHKKKTWLVFMLENGYGPIKKIAVDYLELLSELTVVDHILDESANPTPIHVDMFLQAREEIFSEVEHLQHLVPAMISLEDDEKERAAVTPIIQQVLDNAVVRSFGITLLFCDLVFHIFIVFGWRSVSFGLVQIDYTGEDLGQDNHFARFLQAMYFISSVYFVWRLIGEILSTLITSWQVFKVNFLTFWTFVDITSIIMAFISYKQILEEEQRFFSSDWFKFFAVLAGLLWLKLLSFLKIMNPSLATFVLAIMQIIKDAKWMVLILVMVTLAFGDMFYIIIKTDSDICPADPGEDENPYCDHGLSYLDSFVQILGNFDYGDYLGHPITIVLFVIMTLFGAVIFLNILIAVVSDSYSKATENSARLFGRARILTVAKMDALEHIMQPNFLNRNDKLLIRVMKIIFKVLSLLCFASGFYWLVRFMLNLDDNYGSKVGAVLSTLLMGIFAVAAGIGFSFVITGWGEKRRFKKLRWLNDNVLVLWIFWKPMVLITKLVLGLVFKNNSDESCDDNSDEWAERMKQIDGTITQSVEKSESHLVGIITSLEARLEDTEAQKAKEIEILKEGLASRDREIIQQRVLLENILEKLSATAISSG